MIEWTSAFELYSKQKKLHKTGFVKMEFYKTKLKQRETWIWMPTNDLVNIATVMAIPRGQLSSQQSWHIYIS